MRARGENARLSDAPSMGLALTGRLDLATVRQRTLEARRKLVTDGDLLPEEVFCAQLQIRATELVELERKGSVFTIEVDGQQYYPRIFCDFRLNLNRLYEIARTVAPASAASRLNFLTSAFGALGSQIPLDMLDDRAAYKKLRSFARAWAQEYSRTSLRFYEGQLGRSPSETEAIYICSAEVDPREPLWLRALNALDAPGFRSGNGETPRPEIFTVVVERHTAGKVEVDCEAMLVCETEGADVKVIVNSKKATLQDVLVHLPMADTTLVETAALIFRQYRQNPSD
jgi:hypothetical protein